MKAVRTSLEDRGQPSSTVVPTSPRTAAASLTLHSVAVLPEQFFNLPDGCSTGEAALMRAVLEDAFNCFIKPFVEDGQRAQRLAEEAEAWFFSQDECWPFSFINICTALGLDPEYVRKGLTQWCQQRPAQIRRIRKQTVNRPLSLRTAA